MSIPDLVIILQDVTISAYILHFKSLAPTARESVDRCLLLVWLLATERTSNSLKVTFTSIHLTL